MSVIATKRANNQIYRRKLSKALKLAHKRGCYAGIHNKSSRKKRSMSMKRAWKDGKFDGVFKSPTSIELKVSAALDICGVDHQSQYRPDGYSRIFDEFIPPNILIEINGDWWHSESAAPGIRIRDEEKARWATENGYRVIVFWELEIKKYGAWSLVLDQVAPLLNNR